MRAILIGPDRQVLDEAVIADDGLSRGSGLGPLQQTRLATHVQRPGVYGLNITVSQDRYGDEIVWGFRTNCSRYMIETSRGHRDERRQEPIVLLNPGQPGKVCFVPESFVNLSQAKELILELGGISCYPVLADGSSQRCEYETPVEKLIETLKAEQYSMVEFIPVRNEPVVLAEYVKAIRQAGIAVVAGTEHNTLELLPIEPMCVGGQDSPQDVKDIFWEGVCVLAGHAFLSAHGERGFVDSSADYNDTEERIDAFSRIGDVVLKRYFKM